jgi:hypothetical protein
MRKTRGSKKPRSCVVIKLALKFSSLVENTLLLCILYQIVGSRDTQRWEYCTEYLAKHCQDPWSGKMFVLPTYLGTFATIYSARHRYQLLSTCNTCTSAENYDMTWKICEKYVMTDSIPSQLSTGIWGQKHARGGEGLKEGKGSNSSPRIGLGVHPNS